MGDEPHDPSDLGRLGAQIDAARARQRPERSSLGEEVKAGSLAWRMVTELVVGVLVGGLMGWVIDTLFGTLPIFLIIFGILGFVAGIRIVIRSSREMERRGEGERSENGGAGHQA